MVQMVDAVTRFGRIYLNIREAGCMLFHDWKAVFCNDQSLKTGAHITFGSRTLWSGHTSSAVQQVKEACSFLENCYDEWMAHVNKKRMDHFYLNFFSATQLVLLQTELAKLSSSSAEDLCSDLSALVFPLLSGIKQNVSLMELRNCIKSSLRHIVEDDIDKFEEDASDVFVSAELDKDQLVQKRKRFVEEMVDAGYEMDVIEKALLVCDLDDISEGIMWCMSYVPDDADNKPLGELNQNCSQHHLTFADSTSKIIESLNLEESLDYRLRALWKEFISRTSTSVSDYLSLHHMGYFLSELAMLSTAVNITRPFSGMLRKDYPNIVVCARKDVYRLVLTIYINEGGFDLPLPGSDEVLLCMSTTVADDIELFCRRACGDTQLKSSSKIYCLAFADLLNYEVACKAEEILHKFCHNVPGLQLVVICCRENEIQSHLVSALDRYRVDVPADDSKAIQQYLKKHFIVDHCQYLRDGMNPASHLDPEKSSVRVIKSYRAGVGKTLKVCRLRDSLKQMPHCPDNPLVTISLHTKLVNQSSVLKALLKHTPNPSEVVPRIFHINVDHEIQGGVDHLLFNLLILRSIGDRNSYIWTRMPHDLYVIECMPLVQKEATIANNKPSQFIQVHQLFELLPNLTCWSPTDSLDILTKNQPAMYFKYPNHVECDYDQTMDEEEFTSPTWQLPFQTLALYDSESDVSDVDPETPIGTPAECLQYLLKYCGLEDPSWSELFNFSSFLSVQLADFRQSAFCSEDLEDDLPGFGTFVIRFMIQMSRDFATRSLNISEESPGFLPHMSYHQKLNDRDDGEDDMQRTDLVHFYGLKRKWETTPHPYLFFNSDHQSFTFMGFIVDRRTQNVLDPNNGQIIERSIMSRDLQHALYQNLVDLNENFDKLPREKKIEKMCLVMGQMDPHDPDPTYELTTDNVKKILAIYMRFRCRIPVIIMGETGCGKTRLIKFMCALWLPPGIDLQNMILMKVW